MRILFFGDIVGQIGLRALSDVLPSIREKEGADFVIVNGENASDGFGLSKEDYDFLVSIGADCITLGNHWNSKREISDYIEDAPHLIRPANILHYYLGSGSKTFEVKGKKIQVTNIMGNAFMKEMVASPIVTLTEILPNAASIHIVDYHAESSSEKALFAAYFDGRVSAVIGTHTHVQTADERVSDKGTAFLTDAGLCGAANSVIGFDSKSVIDKMVFGTSRHLSINNDAKKAVNGVVLDIDDTGKTTSIRRINLIDGKEK